MAGDAGTTLAKAEGVWQKAGAVATEVNSKHNRSMITTSSKHVIT